MLESTTKTSYGQLKQDCEKSDLYWHVAGNRVLIETNDDEHRILEIWYFDATKYLENDTILTKGE